MAIRFINNLTLLSKNLGEELGHLSQKRLIERENLA